MSTWNDIKKGKKPWKPKLSARSVAMRLGFCLPFLAFGLFVQWRTAICEVSLTRTTAESVEARVQRKIFGLPFGRGTLDGVNGAHYESEMRTVEKTSSSSTHTSMLHTDTRSVSRVLLSGGPSGEEELAVSEFRFDADQANRELAAEITAFLQAAGPERIDRQIVYGGSSVPVVLASIFLFGLGGFLLLGLLFDFFLWGIQRQARRKPA